ncbi:MAG: aminotransferase class I/II-fold pyridoxal phosphate-dependent enzyme, partial [Chloroflexi bacterium]|nr:aminotransferase class I/II-fold pyridoxal phosphate-dependent enzyme [Chloroflexota bacterium]
AERMRSCYGWEVDPELVLPTTELIQAMYATLLVFSAPGEGAVLQTPIYPPFLMAISETGRRLVDNPLRDDGTRLVLDVDGLRRVVDSGTRVLMVCNPHNPTGRVFERDELLALGNLAVERDLVILVDEIHQDLIYPGHQHIPMATLSPEIAARTITITSATKGFNIAGLRCALMHFGSAELKERFHRLLPERVLGQVSTIGIEATIAAWQLGQPWLDAVLAQLTANRARLTAFLQSDMPAVAYRQPEGTYLAWLDCRDLGLPGSPMQYFLDQAGVALGDGAAFGTNGATCVRLNFATSSTVLGQALDRMAQAVRALGAAV